MTNVQKFLNEVFGEVRCYTDELNNPWFCANDCLKILEYKEGNWRTTISRKCNKKGVTKLKQKDNRGIYQYFNFINEYNLNKLIDEAKNIDEDYRIKFKKWLSEEGLLKNNKYFYVKKEIKFINKLNNFLKKFNIQGEKQYKVKVNNKNYRIDYYIKTLNIAIEYDENNHNNYTYEQQEGRQREIENELGCRFIRVSDSETDEYNVGYVYSSIRKSLIDLQIKLCNYECGYEIANIRNIINKNNLNKIFDTDKETVEKEYFIMYTYMNNSIKQCKDLKEDIEMDKILIKYLK